MTESSIDDRTAPDLVVAIDQGSGVVDWPDVDSVAKVPLASEAVVYESLAAREAVVGHTTRQRGNNPLTVAKEVQVGQAQLTEVELPVSVGVERSRNFADNSAK